MSLILRSVKGSPLTFTEMDGNLQLLYSGSNLTGSNGVTKVGNSLQIGGNLIQNTAINGPYDFWMGQSFVLNSFKVRTENGIELKNYSGGTYNNYINFGTYGGDGVTIISDDDQGSPPSSLNVNPYSITFDAPIIRVQQNTVLSSNLFLSNTLALDFNSIINMDPNGNGNVTGFNSGTAYVYLNGNTGTSEFGYGTIGGQRYGIAAQSNGLFVFDYIGNFAGIKYAADYSANFTSESLVTKRYVDSKKPYKVYTALLTQTSTNAPTAIVLENTMGGTIVWSYDRTGQYIGTLSSVFTTDKVTIFVTPKDAANIVIGGARVDANSVVITTKAANTGTDTDALLFKTPIEIRVYN